MARKSAAAAKVKEPKAPELTEEQKWEEMKSVFEDAKFTYIETVKVQVLAANRVDNYLNIRDLMEKMGFKDPDVDEVKWMLDVSVSTYKQVQEIAESMTMEQMIMDQVPDLFDEIYPRVDEIKTHKDEVVAAIRFMSITPYGNNLVQMHNLIMQEMDRRGLKPKEA